MTDTQDTKINFDEKKWYSLSVSETLRELNTNMDGLSSQEAENRIKAVGENSITEAESESLLTLFINQFKSLLIAILVSAAIISMLIGQPVEAIAILIIVILAGVVGFIQEFQAGKALEALKKMAAPETVVKRDGKETKIEARLVVPGDVVILNAGDQIPADCRIIEGSSIKANESSLTGESNSVDKFIDKIDDDNVAIGDRKNMIFMGTAITNGRCEAVITATGMKTEFGKIAHLLQNAESRKTPLQNNLDELGKKIGVYAIVLAALMSGLGIYRGYDIVEMFVWGVALAVAVIPEALPAVVTVTIALGVRRMVKKKALIRKLPAVETLGSVNIICSDKTGTLTRDEMTVRKVYAEGNVFNVTGTGYEPDGELTKENKNVGYKEYKGLETLLYTGVLCSDTVLNHDEEKWSIIGDPTEGALLTLAEKAGINSEKLKANSERKDEIPFDSDTKRMISVNEVNGKNIAYAKGAPEVIIDKCSYYLIDDDIRVFNDELKTKAKNIAYNFGTEALRVLAFAFKEVTPGETESYEKDLIFTGLTGMIDPPREEAKKAIERCFSAGIKPVMITGDHKITAIAVAKELGVLRDGDVLEGSEVEKLSDDQLDFRVDNTEVFARISPSHKLKIVDSLMRKGHIVAMTGDGVNDAPALKTADIGIAMGIKGTDVSREASDIILTDDNFASIVSAVEEGRSIFQNIKKYLVYLLSGNLGTVFAMVVALLMSLPIPLMAVQILFINFLMDGLMAIALGLEPSEANIMKHKPRDVKKSILSGDALFYTMFIGILIGVLTTGTYLFALKTGITGNRAITLFFASLIMARIFNAANCRSFNTSFFNLQIDGNKPLLLAALVSFVATLLVVYVGFLNTPFHTVPLMLSDWLLVGVSSILVLIVVEVVKVLRSKNQKLL